MKLMTLVRPSALLALAALAQNAHADGRDWARWVRTQVADLPASQTIKAEWTKALAESRAMAQPRYNPELNFGYEQAAETTRTVGLSQTLDWSGKARSAGYIGRESERTAGLRAEQARTRLIADAITALVAHDAARARLIAVREQQHHLDTLGELVRQRESGGDLGRIDARLAFLSLARTQRLLADTESSINAAGVRLKTVFAVDEPRFAPPPAAAWQAERSATTPAQYIAANYDFRLAEAAAALAENSAELAQKQRRPDPTLGFDIGSEGGDILWALKLSLPLPVRNTGRPEYQAALAENDRRLFQLTQTRREIDARLAGALANYRIRRERWQRWRQLAGNDTGDWLEGAWREGELTTQAYLQALDQELETRLAGVALFESMRQAWIGWLFESAQLDAWLGALAAGTAPAVEG